MRVFFEKHSIKKCSRLIKINNAPHFRRRRCSEAAFLVYQQKFPAIHIISYNDKLNISFVRLFMLSTGFPGA